MQLHAVITVHARDTKRSHVLSFKDCISASMRIDIQHIEVSWLVLMAENQIIGLVVNIMLLK